MPDMVNVRKARAGTDSAGHTWPADGAVIAVPVEHALVLVRIPDGGFTIIENVEPADTGATGKSAETAPAEAAGRPSRVKPEAPAPTK